MSIIVLVDTFHGHIAYHGSGCETPRFIVVPHDDVYPREQYRRYTGRKSQKVVHSNFKSALTT